MSNEIQITGTDGVSHLTWNLYSDIINRRYEDGKQVIIHTIISSLTTAINIATDQSEVAGLEHALDIIKGALGANSTKPLV